MKTSCSDVIRNNINFYTDVIRNNRNVYLYGLIESCINESLLSSLKSFSDHAPHMWNTINIKNRASGNVKTLYNDIWLPKKKSKLRRKITCDNDEYAKQPLELQGLQGKKRYRKCQHGDSMS